MLCIFFPARVMMTKVDSTSATNVATGHPEAVVAAIVSRPSETNTFASIESIVGRPTQKQTRKSKEE